MSERRRLAGAEAIAVRLRRPVDFMQIVKDPRRGERLIGGADFGQYIREKKNPYLDYTGCKKALWLLTYCFHGDTGCDRVYAASRARKPGCR